MIHTKRVIFMILPLLFVPLVYGLSSTPDACALPRDPNFGQMCKPALPTNPPVQTCCWRESVPPGTGNPDLGGDEEQYCQTCNLDQNGDPTECTQKELQFIGTSPTPSPTPIPRGPFALPEDGAIQQPTPAPTSPLGPRPFTPLGEGTIQEPQTTPTPAPEDDQSDDGPGPFRGPLGGGVLQEPEDDSNEEEESSNEDEGSDTSGPLT